MPLDLHGHSYRSRTRQRTEPVLVQVQVFCRECAQDIPLLTRIASHVGLILLMMLTIAAGNVQLNASDRSQSAASENPDDNSPFEFNEANDEIIQVAGIVIPEPIAVANIPKRIRHEVVKYAVQPGDTVSDIADEFGVSADSILWANPKLEDNPDMLSLGQVLNIPPATGVLYSVLSGDTLQKIADKFKTKQVAADLLIQNMIKSEFNQEVHKLNGNEMRLTAGQFLMVPAGVKPYVAKAVTAYGGNVPSSAARGTGRFGWPVSGRITQKFWTRHPGIDVGAPTGTPIFAADSGYITFAGWDNAGYGNMILVNHGNGFVTRYAHLSKFQVKVGDSVKKGQIIGRVGSTGNSTGPHLHFEIVKGGGRYNPFSYLR